MANTYTLIEAQTLTSSAATVTFSAIPATYTDLVFRASIRTDDVTGSSNNIYVRFNGLTGNFSYTRLISNGATASSSRASSQSALLTYNAGADAALATANTFSNLELYIPSYTVSQNKPISLFTVQEDNSTTAYIANIANLWSVTAAINSIVITQPGGANLVTGSTFYLYGIKNS